MKRILFVDDEAQILEGLRSSLRKQRHQWDMAFAQGGASALDALRARPFDLVVSDMRMPGMDGAELLGTIKNEFPHIIRIILSGHSERDSIMRALPVCHQFLTKPCSGETLRGVIERACGLHALLESDVLRRIVGSTERLPSLPRVYWDLTQRMANPDVSAKEIAGVVEQDPAMCAKLLQIVNSSYFGLAKRIGAVEPAIVYLGLELVRTLALTAHVFSAAETLPAIPGFSFDELQKHALLTAAVAKKIVPDAKKREEVFTAAVLHDVGKVVLALAVPDQVARIWTAPPGAGTDAHARELEALGVTHAEVGAYLLGLWGLPVSIVEAVAYHHAPASVSPQTVDTVAVVHIADALVDAELSKGPGLRCAAELDPAYLQTLGVMDMMDDWVAIAREAAREGGASKGARR